MNDTCFDLYKMLNVMKTLKYFIFT